MQVKKHKSFPPTQPVPHVPGPDILPPDGPLHAGPGVRPGHLAESGRPCHGVRHHHRGQETPTSNFDHIRWASTMSIPDSSPSASESPSVQQESDPRGMDQVCPGCASTHSLTEVCRSGPIGEILHIFHPQHGYLKLGPPLSHPWLDEPGEK